MSVSQKSPSSAARPSLRRSGFPTSETPLGARPVSRFFGPLPTGPQAAPARAATATTAAARGELTKSPGKRPKRALGIEARHVSTGVASGASRGDAARMPGRLRWSRVRKLAVAFALGLAGCAGVNPASGGGRDAGGTDSGGAGGGSDGGGGGGGSLPIKDG